MTSPFLLFRERNMFYYGRKIAERMIEMSKVYAFPIKRKLPGGMEKELHNIAKNYIETLYAIMVLLDVEEDKPTYNEVLEMVEAAFTDGIYKAIEELEES